jgi:uridine kinase
LQPRIIAIGGPSGSGKSTLAARLAGALPGRAAIVSLDSYYFALDHLSAAEREARNFDHPGSLDWPLLLSHLHSLHAGNAIEEPIYRFDLHTRDVRTRRVEPGDFVLLEGILALHREDVRAAMALRIYIETAEQKCFRRRKERDTVERGRSEASVDRQYTATVLPMAELFVWPTREFADLVVSGEDGYEEPIQQVLAALAPVSPPPVLVE